MTSVLERSDGRPPIDARLPGAHKINDEAAITSDILAVKIDSWVLLDSLMVGKSFERFRLVNGISKYFERTKDRPAAFVKLHYICSMLKSFGNLSSQILGLGAFEEFLHSLKIVVKHNL